MKIAIMACLFAKWNMDVNTSHRRKHREKGGVRKGAI
jgi:hypothetical protein